MLGGLMRDEMRAGVQRVPCLGSIPILGEAFKFTENKQSKTNLMVFLRPHIIKDEHDILNVTNQKYSRIQDLYEQPVSGGTILFPLKDKKMPTYLAPANGLHMEENIPSKTEAK